MPNTAHLNLAIIGLGYVGLPLAVEFGKKRNVIGFDIDEARIAELEAGHDSTLEVENDGMGAYVVSQLVKAMHKRRIHVEGARVLIMGLTFKENCPDLRNTRIIDIVRKLEEYNALVDVYDPWVHKTEAEEEYGITPITAPEQGVYDAIVLAVAHRQFHELGASGIRALGKSTYIIQDLKCVLPEKASDLRL